MHSKSKRGRKKFEVFLDSYVKELVDFLKVHFSDICNSEDAADWRAAATIESWKIILIELDGNSEKIGETVFDSTMSSKTVELLKLSAFYGLNFKAVMLKFLIF
jgi:hypothetical protein